MMLPLLLVLLRAFAPDLAGAPPSAESLFAEAQTSLMHDDISGALTAVQKGLSLAPRSIEGLNLLGIIYEQQNRYEEAEAAFKKALQIAPASTKTHDNLGTSYLLRNQFDLAEHEFRTTLRLNPNDASGNYNLGKLLLQKGDAAAAVRYLERVTERDPSASLILVRAYLRAAQTQKALDLARTLSARSANDPRVHFSLGVELAANKQYAAAVPEFELAAHLLPNTFEILHNLGEAYLRAGNHTEAEHTLKEALALRPDSAATVLLLAQAEAEQRKYFEALDLSLHAHRLQPSNPDILLLLAQISMAENLEDDAISLLGQALQIAPNRPDLHAALGESYLKAGKVERAIDEFKTVINLQPSAAALTFMGEAYLRAGDLDNAKQYLKQALAKDPHNAASLYELGVIASKEGHNEEAEALFTSATKSDPAYDDAVYALATSKMRRGRYDEAVPLLRRCANSMPTVPRVYYRLATAEGKLRQTAAAAQDMQKFKTLSKLHSDERLPIRDAMDALSRDPSAFSNPNIQQLEQRASNDPANPYFSYLLTEAYLRNGDTDKARRAASRIASQAPSLGKLFAKYGQYPDAIDYLQIALDTNPAADDTRHELASAYFKAGQYAQALDILQRMSPQSREQPASLALEGNILARLGHSAQAVDLLQRAVAKSPETSRYSLFLALAQLQAGNSGSAEKTLRDALAHNADSGLLHWGEGVVYVMKNSRAEAEKSFETALDLLPDWQGAYVALAAFYSVTGKPAKAREVLARFHQLFTEQRPDLQQLERDVQQSSPPDREVELSRTASEMFLHAVLATADRL